MLTLFLIGGGWQPEGCPLTFGRFVNAAIRDERRQIVLVIAQQDGVSDNDLEAIRQKYQEVFVSQGVAPAELQMIAVSATKHLTKADLVQFQPTGIFVGGGLTPLYQQALCTDMGWLNYVHARQIPYGGFSAGAAIAAEQAIVGGWKVRYDGQEIPILDPDLAEDLEWLEMRTGLGLVPFAIDVHGSQWGTLTRLIHAIDQGLVTTGWAIDEDTMLHFESDCITISGLGQAYYVRQAHPGKIQVEIFRNGGKIQSLSSREPKGMTIT